MTTSGIDAALADAAPRPFWLDSPAAPPAAPRLSGQASAELVVIGGGYTGLWTALLAKEADPGRDVLLLESRTCGGAASGRNGGFCAASLTHGLQNGLARFPDEMRTLDRLGAENLDAIEKTVAQHGIDCAFERTGEIEVALEPHQVSWARQRVATAQSFGHDAVFLDRDEVRREIASPTYLAGALHRDRVALVDPARLAWGLRAACLRLGVRVAERTAVTGVDRDGTAVRVRTARASVRAARVALATNAFPSPLRRLRPYVVPVWDYALVTEPLSPEQRAEIGWAHRQGVADMGNRFHYYRLTPDDRILFGGYDAVYHWRSGLRDAYDQRSETFRVLAAHFFDTFPQVAGIRFTHRWGGAIDTSTRFFAFQGTAMQGRIAYSVGYTGLGVGASRFGARVMLDLLDGRNSELTQLRAVRARPLPFPPEPVRWLGIRATQRALVRADERGGRRGAWLQVLDRIGWGFDS